MFTELAKDDKGNFKVTEDGKPIYLDEEGAEVPVDPIGMYSKIIDLGKENKTHREKIDQVNKKLSVFEGVEDLEAFKTEAEKAMEAVKNFNEKDWTKVEKVEQMKRQMSEAHTEEIGQLKKSYEDTLSERDGIINKKNEQIRQLMVSTKFASSPMFSGSNPKTEMSADAAEALFGRQIKIEENDNGELKLQCYFANGETVYSRSNPGEPADFNEGIELIWNEYPNKNRYTKSAGAGSGATGGSGGNGGEQDELSKLRKQLEEATAARNTAKMIALRNKITTLQQQGGGRR